MHNFLNFTGPTSRAGGVQMPPIVLFDDFVGSPSAVLAEAGLPAVWDEFPAAATISESLTGVGGILRVQADATAPAIGDHTTIRSVRDFFSFEKGKRLRMVARVQVLPATGSTGTMDWFFGLCGSTTDPFDAVPNAMLGLYARGNTLRNEYTLETKMTDVGSADFEPASDLKLINNRFYELAVEYDGQNTVAWFVDGQQVRRDTRTDRFPFGQAVRPTLSFNALTAEAHEMQIDYIGVMQDRVALS